MKNNLNKGVKVKLVKFVVKLGLGLGIVALVFNACSDKTTQKKLEFLNNLGESKLSFSENEKIERIKAFYREKLILVSMGKVKKRFYLSRIIFSSVILQVWKLLARVKKRQSKF